MNQMCQAIVKVMRSEQFIDQSQCGPALNNFDVLADLDVIVSHLEQDQQKDLVHLIRDFEYLFRDSQGRTNLTCHDVDIGPAKNLLNSIHIA